ncbi:hypothetical protein K443DRAFT_161977 [Laccaria amethystina LaAM-08-1]|uniref:Uncharacterized protein n=1 Tax=Laccaria amethystina LaAM-08-1 TaxID=1095629 RepID=A0A0C9XUQ1_9AGAR|nr:hypothetical protein K443DRAFT_161977 [Laccaria amethystina LaAM-08-1]
MRLQPQRPPILTYARHPIPITFETSKSMGLVVSGNGERIQRLPGKAKYDVKSFCQPERNVRLGTTKETEALLAGPGCAWNVGQSSTERTRRRWQGVHYPYAAWRDKESNALTRRAGIPSVDRKRGESEHGCKRLEATGYAHTREKGYKAFYGRYPERNERRSISASSRSPKIRRPIYELDLLYKE